jgi:hypothetical protein
MNSLFAGDDPREQVALPKGDAVFVAVTSAVGSTECIAINGLVRRATHVFGTDLGPL